MTMPRRALLGAAVLSGAPAGYQAPSLPSTAPGPAAGIVRARLVIVSGTAGGVFVYAGTPALGNPPIFWATSASTDPFGNVLPSTSGVAASGTFTAGNMIVDQTGLYIYSGTPALGNLIVSDCPVAGVDRFGNATRQGATAYQVLGGTRYGVTISTSASGSQPGMSIHNMVNPPFSDPGCFGQASGVAALLADFSITSGQATVADTPSFVTVTSALESGFTNGTCTVQAGFTTIGPAGTLLVDDNHGSLNLTNPVAVTTPPAPIAGVALFSTQNNQPAVLNKNHVNVVGMLEQCTGTSASGNTNNGTTLNALTPAYQIDANDAVNGTAYRLKCGGHGTQGNPAQALTVQFFIFGQTWGGTVTAAADIAVSASFHWDAELTLVVGGAGAAVNGVAWGHFTWGQATAGVSSHKYSMDTQRTAVINTTANANGAFQAGWATGGGPPPTIVCIGSTWERLGP